MEKFKNQSFIIKALIILGLVLIILGSRMVYLARYEVIDLNDYLEIFESGKSGQGHANYYFDIEKFREDYGVFIKDRLGEDYQEELVSLEESNDIDSDEAALIILFNKFINGRLEAHENLANGDSLSFIWEYDSKELKKELGIRIKKPRLTHKVEGLEE